jgi:phage gp29-like protein
MPMIDKALGAIGLARKGQQPAAVEPPPAPPSPFASGFPLSPEQQQIGNQWTASRIFRNSDLAYQENRALQREMLNDPDLGGPLELRMLACYLAGWDVQPVDDDVKDPEAEKQADVVRSCIQRLPDFYQVLRNQSLAIFYGKAGAWLKYEAIEDSSKKSVLFAPTAWLPIHPDSIDFQWNGEPLVKVNLALAPEDARKQGRIKYTELGAAMQLTPEQRSSMVLSVFNRESADFLDTSGGGRAYAGHGLRSRLYRYWFLKQKHLQAAGTYAERHGRGQIVARYPSGNAQIRREVFEAIANYVGDTVLLFPKLTGDDSISIEFNEPQGSGWQLHWRMTQDYSDKITKRILGQSLTTGTAPTGMGSGVADVHAETFRQIVASDAKMLEGTLTRDLVNVIQRINFPDGPRPALQFRLLVEDPKAERFIAAVETAVQLGVSVPECDVREALAIREPNEGEEVIGAGLDPLDAASGVVNGQQGGGKKKAAKDDDDEDDDD